MRSIAFLICSNGFGHYKRSLRTADALLKKDPSLEIRLFCTKLQIRENQSWSTQVKLQSDSQVTFYPVSSNVEWNRLQAPTYEMLCDWEHDFPWEELVSADLVISDNISAVLSHRPDAILSSSFLWSEVFIDQKPEDIDIQRFHEREVALLEQHKPSMICLKDMLSPYVEKYTNVVPTSWPIEKQPKTAVRNQIKNILVLGGGTGAADYLLCKILNEAVENQSYHWITTDRLQAQIALPERVQLFDFQPASFAQIDLLICRAGIGSITDGIRYGIPILAVAEKGNHEVNFNAERIAVMGIGLHFSEDLSLTTIDSIGQNGHYREMQVCLQHIDCNGLQETIDFLTTALAQV